jgi:HAMP domain-containing protein
MMLAIALIGMAALYGDFTSAALLENQIRDKFTAVSSYAMEKIHRLFSRRFEDIARLARDPVIVSRTSTARRITATLREYKRHFESYAPYASLSFYRLNGTWIAGTDGGSNGRMAGAFDGLPMNRSFLLETGPADTGSGKAFHLAHVVTDAAGSPFGVVVADLPTESLRTIVKRPLGLLKGNSDLDVDLIDAKGLLLFSTQDPQGVFRNRSLLADVVRTAKADSSGSGTLFLASPRGSPERQIVVFAREATDAAAATNGWTLIISLPTRSALAPLLAMKNRLLLVFIVIVGIAVGIVLLFSRTITRPLARLSEAIAEIGKGNLDAVVPVTSHDEIGRLSVVFNGMVAELRQVYEQLRDAATIDSLTNAFNRNSIDNLLRQQTERARRYKSPLSLIMFDLDHFKLINDTYGHLSGDSVLKTLCGIIRDNIRRTDLLGRWGGEEFMLLTPGIGLEQAALKRSGR